MKRAIERHEAGEARVIPVILRPVDWQDAPFSKLQALPKDGRPVTTWPNIDEAFLDIARGIRKAIEGFGSSRKKTAAAKKLKVVPKTGKVETDKVEYVVVLMATIEEMNKSKIEAIHAHMRKFSGDAELTITRVVPGSVKIYLKEA